MKTTSLRDITGPLTGERFRDWSDRLRDVEEMVADPELRAEAARIRERARAMRAELKRHSAEPNWELVQSQVAGPLVELRDRVAAELFAERPSKPSSRSTAIPCPPSIPRKRDSITSGWEAASRPGAANDAGRNRSRRPAVAELWLSL